MPELLIALLLFVVGVVLIIKGGDYFVDASSWMGDVTGISKAVIGATIVSFATTSPEFFVSVLAVLKGSTDLSIGNAIGSVSCNLGIAFGLIAFFTPGVVRDGLFWVKGAIMLLSAVLLLVLSWTGVLSPVGALVLLGVFVVFTIFNIRFSKDEKKPEKKPTSPRDIGIHLLKFVGGAAAVIFGSDLIVDNVQIIARHWNISEAVIGLTVVAIGTSLPEIVTSITAIVKKQNALSIGNIIGANVLDLTLILSTGALISGGSGLTVSESAIRVDMPIAILLILIGIIPTIIGKKVYRWQGLLMFLVYFGYLIFITMLS